MALPGSVFVVGGDGLIGSALVRRLGQAGAEVFTSSRRPSGAPNTVHLDLAEPASWPDFPRADAAVLCAGNTSIASCAEEKGLATRVNVEAMSELAALLSTHAKMVLLLSSNQVFDGSTARRNRTDAPCPVCEYGRQKASAEAHVLEFPGGAVLRLTKVLTPKVPLLLTWRESLEAGEAITPFENFPLAPVPLDFVIRSILGVLSHGNGGIYQVSGAEDLTYVDLAHTLVRNLGFDTRLVRPMSADAGQLGFAQLPRYSTLEMEVETDQLGLVAPSSDGVLEEVVRGFVSAAPVAAHG